MKHLIKFENVEEIPWAEENRLTSGYKLPITRDNLPKKGDRVRCIPEYKPHGAYIPGKIVVVDKVTNDSDKPIIWPEGGGSGIYFDALEYV